MNKQILLVVALVATVSALAYAVTSAQERRPSAAEQLERGRYIVNGFGCVDCHSPWKLGPNGPEPDAERYLSGHPESFELPAAPQNGASPWNMSVAATNTAWAGPWGVSFTANLTPDPETGLGRWTEQEFLDTLRTGRHQGRGREILPPMPFPALRQLSDGDLRAVFAYLQSLPPIKNRVPNPRPPPAQ